MKKAPTKKTGRGRYNLVAVQGIEPRTLRI